MDPRRSAALAEFRDFLQSAIDTAKVNYSMTDRLSKQLHGQAGAHGAPLRFVSRSTLNEHVHGKRRQNLPKWPWVTNLWGFLVVAAAQNKVDPARLGTLQEWEAVYERTAARLRDLKGDGPLGAPFEPEPAASLIDPSSTWWASYADVVAPWFQRYLNLEPLSGHIRCYENLYIPGLLQTEKYAEAVIRLRHDQESESDIRRRVALRMLRQQLLPYKGRRIWALINEMALWNPLVCQAAMNEQLRHLIDIAPHVTIQIVPADAPVCELVSGPITILRFGHEGMADTVYLEQSENALYPDDPLLRAEYLKQFGSLALAAYRPPRSLEIIEGLID